MAAYSDINGRYAHKESITAPRYNLWAPPNKESKTSSYQWGKTGSIADDEGNRDHVCRPVLIDAQGRRRPIVASTPNNDMGHYITTTETITEHIIVPQVNTYRTGSPIEGGRDKDYRGFNNGLSWPVSAYQGHHDRPPRVDAFISKIQDEASRPTRPNLDSNSYRQQRPNSYSYGMPSDSGNINRWNKPARDPYFDISAGRSHIASSDGYQDPDIITEGGWVRPNRQGWSKPISNTGSLTDPTNDIGAAIDYLKDAVNATSVNPAPPRNQFTVPATIVPKVHTYETTIDSSEAKRKYGGFSGPQQTINTTETYSSTIDSREVARRYKGEIL